MTELTEEFIHDLAFQFGLQLEDADGNPDIEEFARAAIAADRAANAQGEPVAWLVCSVNSDGSLSLEHAAAWAEAAHEHINDAITEHEIEDAGAWVVRPAYTAPQPAIPEGYVLVPMTDAEIDRLWQEPMSADWEHREFARAIERHHGIGGKP